jgi:hypothetical protein
LYSISDLFGRKYVDHAGNQPTVLEGRTLVAEDDDDEITKRPSKFVHRLTHLDASNVIADVPMESDLVTVNELRKYVSKIQEDMIAIEAEISWEDVIPIMQNISVALSCDGAPAFALLRMRRRGRIKNEETVPFTIISGAFCLLFSAYKANGKLFGFSHLREFFSLQRSTDKQLDWVMKPGDPNQFEDELMMIVFGLPVDAIMGLIETKRREDQNATVEVSVADVMDHKLAKACNPRIPWWRCSFFRNALPI